MNLYSHRQAANHFTHAWASASVGDHWVGPAFQYPRGPDEQTGRSARLYTVGEGNREPSGGNMAEAGMTLGEAYNHKPTIQPFAAYDVDGTTTGVGGVSCMNVHEGMVIDRTPVGTFVSAGGRRYLRQGANISGLGNKFYFYANNVHTYTAAERPANRIKYSNKIPLWLFYNANNKSEYPASTGSSGSSPDGWQPVHRRGCVYVGAYSDSRTGKRWMSEIHLNRAIWAAPERVSDGAPYSSLWSAVGNQSAYTRALGTNWEDSKGQRNERLQLINIIWTQPSTTMGVTMLEPKHLWRDSGGSPSDVDFYTPLHEYAATNVGLFGGYSVDSFGSPFWAFDEGESETHLPWASNYELLTFQPFLSGTPPLPVPIPAAEQGPVMAMGNLGAVGTALHSHFKIADPTGLIADGDQLYQEYGVKRAGSINRMNGAGERISLVMISNPRHGFAQHFDHRESAGTWPPSIQLDSRIMIGCMPMRGVWVENKSAKAVAEIKVRLYANAALIAEAEAWRHKDAGDGRGSESPSHQPEPPMYQFTGETNEASLDSSRAGSVTSSQIYFPHWDEKKVAVQHNKLNAMAQTPNPYTGGDILVAEQSTHTRRTQDPDDYNRKFTVDAVPSNGSAVIKYDWGCLVGLPFSLAIRYCQDLGKTLKHQVVATFSDGSVFTGPIENHLINAPSQVGVDQYLDTDGDGLGDSHNPKYGKQWAHPVKVFTLKIT